MHLLLIPWFKWATWPIPLPLGAVLPLQAFGGMAAIAIVLGAALAELRAKRTGVSPELVSAFIVRVIMIGIASAMVLNVVFYEPTKLVQIIRAIGSWFGEGPKETVPYPGLSSFGGFIGGTIAALRFSRKRRVSLLVLFDICFFAFPFAWIFARAGCFIVHDHPGLESTFLLAVDNYNGQGVARHDLGLYEMIWALIMTPVVLWIGRKPRPFGFFAALVPLAYAPVRFMLDFLRETPEHGGDLRYFGLTPGQYASIVLLLVGSAVAIRVARGPAASLSLDEASAGPQSAAGG